MSRIISGDNHYTLFRVDRNRLLRKSDSITLIDMPATHSDFCRSLNKPLVNQSLWALNIRLLINAITKMLNVKGKSSKR